MKKLKIIIAVLATASFVATYAYACFNNAYANSTDAYLTCSCNCVTHVFYLDSGLQGYADYSTCLKCGDPNSQGLGCDVDTSLPKIPVWRVTITGTCTNNSCLNMSVSGGMPLPNSVQYKTLGAGCPPAS